MMMRSRLFGLVYGGHQLTLFGRALPCILQPRPLVSPGLKDIKKVEIYTQFRPLLRKESQNITGPHPGE
jgi:hypothetical protein